MEKLKGSRFISLLLGVLSTPAVGGVQNNLNPAHSSGNTVQSAATSLITPLNEQKEFRNKIPNVPTTKAINSAEKTKQFPNGDTSFLNELKKLRDHGELDKAVHLALTHLQTKPNDVDVRLVLGLMYIQLTNYPEAESILRQVLNNSPDYIDARLGLIKVYIVKKEYQDASQLVNEGLKRSPHNKELLGLKKNIAYLQDNNVSSPKAMIKTHKTQRQLSKHEQLIIQAHQYIAAKNYRKAEYIALSLLNKNPADVEARIILADDYLAQTNDQRALHVIKQGLKISPNNAKLLVKEGEIRFILQNYALSLDAFKKALRVDHNNNHAKDLMGRIMETRPRFNYGMNEIGILTDNAYVADLHSIWDYTSAFYRRDTDLGPITAKVNYASRQQKNAAQYEIDFSPRFNRHVYFDLAAAFANQPALFPKEFYAAEGYVDTPIVPQVSLGAKYSNIGPTYFKTYTGSLNFYPGNFWIAFRPYYYVPKNSTNSSILYTATIRRYFATDDHYISLNLGSGRSPDLADLLTVNFIIIQNNFINLNYEFPIINHKLIIDLGVGYANWKYPGGLSRDFYDGNLGLKYRF